MVRKIIQIEEDKCNGCGICATACHECAIGIVNGKAKLLRDDYCDGLGDCLPACPTKAIHFIEREADAYNEAAVNAAKQKKTHPNFSGCPGSAAKEIHPKPNSSAYHTTTNSQLTQWPVQIKLAPVTAPYFQNANLLIAADCTAYAYGDFHNKFIHNRITLIGCPKLDSIDYTEKLTDIISNNAIKSITIARMEVPCCGGLEQAVKAALQASQKFIPWQVVIISTNGTVISE